MLTLAANVINFVILTTCITPKTFMISSPTTKQISNASFLITQVPETIIVFIAELTLCIALAFLLTRKISMLET